ncbi:hypothetical protein DPMN_079927 [Dreissena polymorpha]|uniref:C-type lectin domain-containing protein n=1 Tax=Dreissena polymorpha TaxID=45954 RepID=A0A9D4BRJ5_DREPO|nr:hypothetical protein DPMN_079927 [Dreissena polymorpha]
MLTELTIALSIFIRSVCCVRTNVTDLVTQSVNVTDLVTQSDAEERCTAFGGLASFEYFSPPPGTSQPWQLQPENVVPQSLNKSLTKLNISENESVWVSGRTNYSGFIAWHICLSSINQDFLVNISVPNSNIYNCSETCKNKTSFFGIKLNECYCVRNIDSRVCTDDDFATGIHIYEIFNDTFTEKQSFQCVQVMYNTNVKYKTSKCSANFQALCTSWRKANEQLICTDQNTTKPVCVYNDSMNWFKNREWCFSHNGKLFPYLYDSTTNFTKPDTWYSLGKFRSFKPVKNAQHNDICLSVTRIGKSYWLEPDQCTETHRYLCNNVSNGDELKTNTTVGTSAKLHQHSTSNTSLTTLNSDTPTTSGFITTSHLGTSAPMPEQSTDTTRFSKLQSTEKNATSTQKSSDISSTSISTLTLSETPKLSTSITHDDKGTFLTSEKARNTASTHAFADISITKLFTSFEERPTTIGINGTQNRTTENNNFVAIVVGAVVGTVCLVVVILVVTCIVCRTRKSPQKSSQTLSKNTFSQETSNINDRPSFYQPSKTTSSPFAMLQETEQNLNVTLHYEEVSLSSFMPDSEKVKTAENIYDHTNTGPASSKSGLKSSKSLEGDVPARVYDRLGNLKRSDYDTTRINPSNNPSVTIVSSADEDTVNTGGCNAYDTLGKKMRLEAVDNGNTYNKLSEINKK